MPTLLQINVTANWGSTGKIAEQIGQLAQNYGWKSYIAYGRNMNPSKNTLIRIGGMMEVYEHYLENIFLDNEGLASRRATKKFLKEIDKIKPDVVHLHNIHDHYLNYRFLFSYLAQNKIPVVWTQHDQWATTGHCCYNMLDCERWKELCYDCPLSKWYSLDRSRRNYMLKKQLLEALPSLTIIPVSEWLAENIRLSCMKDRYIEVIHNGIDLNVFQPLKEDVYERYGIAKGKKIILGVAAVWDQRKGLVDLCKLSESLSSEEYAIVVVGKLPDSMTTIKDNVNRCQMVFIGRTQNVVELAQLYSAATVFVNPTYADIFPTVNLEALACGTPVITYRTGGSPEAIDHATGAIVEQGDIIALYEKIKEFSAINFKDNHTDDCRMRAENLYNKDNCFMKYIHLYNRLIGD